MHYPPPNDAPPDHIQPPQQGSIPPWGYGSPPPPRQNNLVWVFVGVGLLFFFGIMITAFVVGVAVAARAGQRAPHSDPATASSTAPELPAARRNVPTHDTSLLTGCSSSDLDMIERSVGAAIDIGAPTYNRGDFQGCFSTYEKTARNIESVLPASCQGPATALASGRSKAATMSEASDKAWAMRDAFDGLLDVIDRAR